MSALSPERETGPPAVLYIGDVMHQRMRPVARRFSYSVFSLAIDLDRLDEANRLTRLFSVNRFNILAFHEADHLPSAGPDLRARFDALLTSSGVSERAARVDLVCYPRILGWVFNPIAVYYAYAADGALLALVYEVRNTFGDRHSYVCPVMNGQVSEAGIRQMAEKRMHVSPFLGPEGIYHFRMKLPEASLHWRILETDGDGPILAATFSGSRRDLSARTIVSQLAHIPHLTLKVLAAIHWQALKIWMSGIKFHKRPAPREDASVWSGEMMRDRQISRHASVGGSPDCG
ncbi:hypothetical protein BJF93_09765 [Xaviernesmea oryzae]|uniref:DUF1365 domain-containing protein n=1 Tax=Xaviernesmea oryzae TaxID=464029 RepID=A0A1Q9AWS6_9HYPH|nr:DUF1365 domain-containing protein [Xaviernesmea oryzae]OLP59885.1 hypothetical protein BJF93_09765 [Xaviernesmea oryzae]SEK47225.1 hypothetical protein SAMN04487976_102262 [Xaviernesmea oryzae]